MDWIGGQRGPQGIGRLERGETCGHLWNNKGIYALSYDLHNKLLYLGIVRY